MKLLDRLDAIIDQRHLLTHPFYRRWADGTLPVASLQEYARQYYAFESRFPRFLSALHSHSDRPDVRAALLENLWDEEHGDVNHQELWLRFAEGIGASRTDVHGAAWNDATRNLLDTYERLCRDAAVAAGVAAVYAYERQVPAVAAAKIDGLRRNFGVDDARTLAFFEVHAGLDVEHADAERRIVASLANGDQEPVLRAASTALDAWWGFLDAADR